MQDNLELCPLCKELTCYKTYTTEDIFVKQCIGCGMQTNSLLIEGTEFFEAQLQNLPFLYKDLLQTDNEGLNWLPNVINNPKKGIVFVEGTNILDWEWKAMKAVKIPPKQRKQFNNAKYKMDNKSKKGFGKDGYIDALKYIGLQI